MVSVGSLINLKNNFFRLFSQQLADFMLLSSFFQKSIFIIIIRVKPSVLFLKRQTMLRTYLLAFLFLQLILTQPTPEGVDPIVVEPEPNKVQENAEAQQPPQPTKAEQQNLKQSGQNENVGEKVQKQKEEVAEKSEENLQQQGKNEENVKTQQQNVPQQNKNAEPAQNDQQLNKQQTNQQAQQQQQNVEQNQQKQEQKPQDQKQEQKAQEPNQQQKVEDQKQEQKSKQQLNKQEEQKPQQQIKNQQVQQEQPNPEKLKSQNQDKPQQNQQNAQPNASNQNQEKKPQIQEEKRPTEQEIELRKKAQEQINRERERVIQQKKAEQIRQASEQARRRGQDKLTEEQRRQRSEKYRVEQERIRQIKKRQEQMRQKYERQKVENGIPQTVEYTNDGSLTKTQKKRKQQKVNKSNARKAMFSENRDMTTKEFLFEIGPQMHEFAFTPASDQNMSFQIRLFTHMENTYSEIKDIDTDAPIKIFIYENNQRIITQNQFYFMGIMTFPAKKQSQYMIRFFNSGSDKLIEVRHTYIIQTSKVADLLDTKKAEKHGQQARTIRDSLDDIIRSRQLAWVMESEDMSEMGERLRRYYIYEIMEMIITIGICYAQVKMIKKLLSGQSVV